MHSSVRAVGNNYQVKRTKKGLERYEMDDSVVILAVGSISTAILLSIWAVVKGYRGGN
jgi:hypothetical protein